MQYLCMLYLDETEWAKMSLEAGEQRMAAYTAYDDALRQAGVHVGGSRLHPSSTATTIRNADDRPMVLDGPYADSKEQLGGYFIIDVPDMDAAISWASRCPTTGHGVVEIRPLSSSCESATHLSPGS